MYSFTDIPILNFLIWFFIITMCFVFINGLLHPPTPSSPPPPSFIKPKEKPLYKSVAKSYKFETGMTKQEVLNAIAYFIRCNEYYKVKFLTDTEILNHVYLRDEYSQNQKGEKTTTWVFGTKNSGNTFKFTEGGTLKYVVIKNLNEFTFVEK